MPYTRKGKCVYKKTTGKKVGCSKSIARAKKYLKALHANIRENLQFDIIYNTLIEELTYNTNHNK